LGNEHIAVVVPTITALFVTGKVTGIIIVTVQASGDPIMIRITNYSVYSIAVLIDTVAIGVVCARIDRAVFRLAVALIRHAIVVQITYITVYAVTVLIDAIAIRVIGCGVYRGVGRTTVIRVERAIPVEVLQHLAGTVTAESQQSKQDEEWPTSQRHMQGLNTTQLCHEMALKHLVTKRNIRVTEIRRSWLAKRGITLDFNRVAQMRPEG